MECHALMMRIAVLDTHVTKQWVYVKVNTKILKIATIIFARAKLVYLSCEAVL